MPESISTTALRANLYRLLDQVLESGEPLRVKRGKRSLIIMPEDRGRRRDLSKLARREAITCTPDELIEAGFADEWHGDQ